MGLTAHGSEFAKLEYSSDNGSSWNEIPGISGYTESGGEAPERDVVAFSGVAKRSGHPRVPSIEVNAVYSPSHPAWKAVRKASLDRDVLKFRLTTAEEEIFSVNSSGNTVAIAITTGVVTFAGTQQPGASECLSPGQVIKVGSSKHVIDSINDSGKPVVKPAPDQAVDAVTNYSIVLPSLRRGPFDATVRLAGNVSLETEGDLTTSLMLSPRGQLPEWVIA